MGGVSIARSIAMGLLLGVLTPVGEARADPGSPADIEEARAHYRRGVELYDAKKYEAALVELERANSLAPTYRLLYNIALVQEQLGDAAGALRSFGSYLDAGADVPAVRHAEVERAMAALVVKVATVTVTSNVAGAEVSVDDGVAGTTPLAAPLRLNAGPHRLAATKDGYRPTTKAIDVVGGDRLEVPFSLEELPPAGAAAAAPASGDSRRGAGPPARPRASRSPFRAARASPADVGRLGGDRSPRHRRGRDRRRGARRLAHAERRHRRPRHAGEHHPRAAWDHGRPGRDE